VNKNTLDTEKTINVRRHCPICSSSKAKLLHTQVFSLYEGHSLPAKYEIVSCEVCDFVYNESEASQKDYNYFYNQLSKYESSVAPAGLTLNKYDVEKYGRIVDTLEGYLKNKDVSILDVGCASGGLLRTFKTRGFTNLTGFDPSASCVNTLRSFEVKGVQGGAFIENFADPNDFSNNKEKFDCVTFSHVLEHVHDLDSAVQNLISYVKKDGLLYIEVPDATRYTQYYISPFHYFDFEHINHFGPKSLNNLMSKHDCTLIASGSKDLPHSSLEFYPAVFALFKVSKSDKAPHKLENDLDCRNNVTRYIGMSDCADSWPDLESISKDKTEVVVWGAGAYALRLHANTMLRECNIKCFVDNDSKKHGVALKDFKKLKILSPQEVLKDFKGPIIVCSALYNHEIVKEIEGMGLKNKLIVLK
jgi:2-polyprenyl-3-methyl-5-hydroxy-6-metoxy-1,4-benzoquinol methylase